MNYFDDRDLLQCEGTNKDGSSLTKHILQCHENIKTLYVLNVVAFVNNPKHLNDMLNLVTNQFIKSNY